MGVLPENWRPDGSLLWLLSPLRHGRGLCAPCEMSYGRRRRHRPGTARPGDWDEPADGTRIVALVNIEAIKDDFGRVIGAVNVFRDRPVQRAGKFHLNGGGRNSDELLLALPAAIYTTDAT